MTDTPSQQRHWSSRAQYIYESHQRTKSGSFLLRQTVERIVSMGNVAPDGRILEVGCAAGTQTLALRQQGFPNAWGMDVNTEVLTIARSNAEATGIHPGGFVAGDAFALPFPDRSFECVFSVGVMEHLPRLTDALLEQRRVLRPGGWLVMAVPNAYCPWWSTIKKWRAALSRDPVFAFPEVFRTFTLRQGVSAMTEAGLRDVTVQPADAILPQCPDWLATPAISLAKLLASIPGLKHLQAMLYFAGRR